MLSSNFTLFILLPFSSSIKWNDCYPPTLRACPGQYFKCSTDEGLLYQDDCALTTELSTLLRSYPCQGRLLPGLILLHLGQYGTQNLLWSGQRVHSDQYPTTLGVLVKQQKDMLKSTL